MGPHPAVAAIRLAVRRVLHDVLTEHVTPLPPGLPSHSSGAPTDGVLPPAESSVPLASRPATPGSPGSVGPVGPVGPAPADSPRASADSGRPPASAVPAGPGAARSAARPTPTDSPPLVLVACSGGADSVALASALAFEAPRLGLRAGGVTVDHGLQPGSAERAAEVVDRMHALRLEPVVSVAVSVPRTTSGPEAAAREARYAALDEAAERLGAAAVLLGHTRDDQAETVLLGLARGSGTRSLSGMAAVTGPGGRYRRPFLAIDRQSTRRACMVQSLPVWDDPHNTDPAYTRSRVRHEALPALEKALGKGVVDALARTAQLSRDDADALDRWADEAERTVRLGASPVRPARTAPRRDAVSAEREQETAERGAEHRGDERGGCELDVARLYALPPAVRRRVLRRAAIGAGSPAGSLFARHVEEIDRLITAWRGQRAISLPGRVEARRQGGRLVIRQGSQS
ncbi:tRNA lysidine(34) synthetase TilS [Streptomyces sp. AJS327]|uniref:tRNA lysidine(34) synthetase TilS n=1 Tax=Streptomyces sp. AJS327 TaxID=2545265 RepID=UPI0015DF1E69|nr:tRNA lysidine(34) synthetase TilS [Streptomyces sp. AJS327]MBA0053063.1 tRNA lysidine(34) synthetase TilS [Streptomyces sp. AJS327]